MPNDNYHHILSLSGGKDSSALAIYLKDKVPDIEYVFCDTGKELQETYDFLNRLEVFLGKKITVLMDEQGFDHWLNVFGGYLPSPTARWCTKELKLRPFERYVGDSLVINYIGLRADEDREGYISHKPNLKPVFPFKDDGLVYRDIERILIDSGLGMPAYRSWRSRSGCSFCFYQQKIEWVGLLENHPKLFWEAADYEKFDEAKGKRYTWIQKESLEELAKPERVAQIKENFEKRQQSIIEKGNTLVDIFDDPDDQTCLICTL
jgi:hypothetical protein